MLLSDYTAPTQSLSKYLISVTCYSPHTFSQDTHRDGKTTTEGEDSPSKSTG